MNCNVDVIFKPLSPGHERPLFNKTYVSDNFVRRVEDRLQEPNRSL